MCVCMPGVRVICGADALDTLRYACLISVVKFAMGHKIMSEGRLDHGRCVVSGSLKGTEVTHIGR